MAWLKTDLGEKVSIRYWSPSHPLGEYTPSVSVGGHDVNIPAAIGTGGASILPDIGGDIIDNKLLKPRRDADNATKGELERQKGITDNLGISELGQYGAGLAKANTYDPDKVTLSSSELAMLDASQQSQETRVNSLMAKLGMSNSTMAAAMLSNIDRDRVIDQHNMLTQDKAFVFQQKMEAFNEAHTHYQNAIQALGLSNSYMQQAMAIDQAYSNQMMETWTALIGAGATIAGGFAGGPAGAAAGGTAAKAGTSGMTTPKNLSYNYGSQPLPTVNPL